MTLSTPRLSIELNDSKASFRPGEVVLGSVNWNLSELTKKVAVTLLWKTSGMGNEDSQNIASAESADHPPLAGTLPFSFQLPLEPCSFSGQLVNVIWSIEAKALKTDLTQTQEIIVSPTGDAIRPEAGVIKALVEV